MKKILSLALLFFALMQSTPIVAQDLMKAQDLSTLKVDYLSDADVAKIRTQLEAEKLTIEQAEQVALAKGMPANEFAKLKARLGMKSSNATKSKLKKPSYSFDNDSLSEDEYARKQEKIINKKVKDSLNALVFGSELFDNPTLNFEPNLKLATPVNYVLGPGD